MAIIEAFLRRPVAILKMPDAIKRGLSVEGFIRELKSLGLSYRHTNMLADWRSVAGIEARKDVIKYVRKDRVPSPKLMADVEWSYSKEYIYRVNTWSRTRPDEPLVQRTVTLLSDKPLTPKEAEEEIYTKWGAWERYMPEHLERAEVGAIYHKIPSAIEKE